jgi:hypothetical protein
MPIDKEEFRGGELQSKIEDEIFAFLNERKEKAYTSQEIMGGTKFSTNFSSPEIAEMSTFAIADFTILLHELVNKGRLKMKINGGQMYFLAGPNVIAKCPKCNKEVIEPRKTWKMTGRPDKKGRRLQMKIGLFKCPRHGNFRIALSKQKI